MPVNFNRTFSIVQNDPDGRVFFQDGLFYLADGITLWPSISLADHKIAATSALDAACAAHHAAGFSSNVVVTDHPYHYPYASNDQIDMLAGVVSNGSVVVYCQSDTGVWAERSHTAEQLAAVWATGETFRRALLAACRTAKIAVMAATTTVQVQSAVASGLAAMQALI